MRLGMVYKDWGMVWLGLVHPANYVSWNILITVPYGLCYSILMYLLWLPVSSLQQMVCLVAKTLQAHPRVFPRKR